MALYNNGYPATYQPIYQPYQQPTQQINGIIWVQGEAGAKSYLVAPNSTVQLWDSESQTIYLKSADGSGMPSIKTLDYTIRENTQNRQFNGVSNGNDNLSTYATKDDLKAISERLNALERSMKHESSLSADE